MSSAPVTSAKGTSARPAQRSRARIGSRKKTGFVARTSSQPSAERADQSGARAGDRAHEPVQALEILAVEGGEVVAGRRRGAADRAREALEKDEVHRACAVARLHHRPRGRSHRQRDPARLPGAAETRRRERKKSLEETAHLDVEQRAVEIEQQRREPCGTHRCGGRLQRVDFIVGEGPDAVLAQDADRLRDFLDLDDEDGAPLVLDHEAVGVLDVDPGRAQRLRSPRASPPGGRP